MKKYNVNVIIISNQQIEVEAESKAEAIGTSTIHALETLPKRPQDFFVSTKDRDPWLVSVHDSEADGTHTYVFIGTEAEAKKHLLQEARKYAESRKDDLENEDEYPKTLDDIDSFAYGPYPCGSKKYPIGVLYTHIQCCSGHLDFTATKLYTSDIIVAQ